MTTAVRGTGQYERLLGRCKDVPPIVTAVAHPCDDTSLFAVIDAAREGIIEPILCGPADRIRRVADDLSIDLELYEIVDAPDSRAAAARAVELVTLGLAEVLMKGSLHTDELMGEVVKQDPRLRSDRGLSHVFVMDVPTYHKPLIVADAAVNIFPTLDDKRDIVQNAVDLARALGIEQPKVAILSAVETVTANIPSTVEAAALCKMAERGQITGAIVDGPLGFHNAISAEAARVNHTTSSVAGDADILIVPDLEAVNMLAKNLTFMACADAARIVLGACAPIVLTSRADNERTRLSSCAVAALYAHARRTHVSLTA
jgi:phosphate acetyltransferase